MKFDSEKWALSFYDVVDERFQVESDVLQLYSIDTAKIQKNGDPPIKSPRFFSDLEIWCDSCLDYQ